MDSKNFKTIELKGQALINAAHCHYKLNSSFNKNI